MKIFYFPLSVLFFFLSVPAFATVVVSSPYNGATVGTSVHYSATASTDTCSKGVASMGVYVDNKLIYVVSGTKLNTTLPVSAGSHNTVVEEWDYCGGASYYSMQIKASSQAGVYVTLPAANSTVGSLVDYMATGISSCSKGVASMGIYVNNQLVYVSNGPTLNKQLSLPAGNQHTVVEEWDYCGGASYTTVNLNVQGGTTLSNLQASSGWNGWGELAPDYSICSSCSGVWWSALQHENWTSLSGNGTEYQIGGSSPYSDVLWSLPVLGQNSTQGIYDSNHTLLPSLHNFTYDASFYVTNAPVTQVVEFDINMYMNGVGMIWGNQCNNLGGGTWDIWNNANAQWVSTGIPCSFINNGWNHVTIHAQRQSDNSITYQSITINGLTYKVNWTVAPFQVPSSWWGVTVNYQMDGNYNMTTNTTYLDNFNLNYW